MVKIFRLLCRVTCLDPTSHTLGLLLTWNTALQELRSCSESSLPFFFFPGGPRVLVMLCEADPNKGGTDSIWPLTPSLGAAPWAGMSAETMREEPVGGVRLSLE